MLIYDKKKRIDIIKGICLNPIFEVCRSISNCFGFIANFDEVVCCRLMSLRIKFTSVS